MIPKKVVITKKWFPQWRSTAQGLDGAKVHLLCWHEGRLQYFNTRRECRAWIKHRYGYIATRKDLRVAPHGWRVPTPVRATISIEKEI